MMSASGIWLGLIEGIGLVVSPCILPVLPLILSGSLTGSRRRPFGIILGFVIFFSLFTLFSRSFVQYSGIDPLLIRLVSYALLIVMAVTMMSGYLSEKWMFLTARFMRADTRTAQQEGFWGGILFGGLTAIIWTPCAGPILAAVIVQISLQQAGWDSLMILLAFALGAGLPMLFVVFFGRAAITRVAFLQAHTALLRKGLGLVILLAVGGMIHTEFAPTSAVQPLAVTTSAFSGRLEKGLVSPYNAPEIKGIQLWLNSPPLQIEALRGKVILIDFWTYSCINCLRTLPYLRGWYDRYHDKGLVIIGVHTPEFEFEKNVQNISRAVQSEGILYPVAVDNDYRTWLSFHNKYWPAHYLIDRQGRVVYEHFGEGEYDTTENNIRYLLGIHPESAGRAGERMIFNPDQTPETYFGTARAANYAGNQTLQRASAVDYVFPDNLPIHGWALSGRWQIYPDRIVSAAGSAALRIHFNAGKVFFVMGSADNQPLLVSIIFRGGKELLQIKDHRLYTAVTLQQPESGVVEIRADRPGLEIYTATFG